MKIARVIARLNVGGPAKHVAWLTAAIPETRLITGTIPPGEEDMSAFAASLGVHREVISDMSRAISWRDALVVWKLFQIFRRFRPDIIHTHTAKAGTTGRIAGLLYRWTTNPNVKLVHTFHGHVFHGYYGKLVTWLFIVIERILARFTDAIIVLSRRQRMEIHETYRVGKEEQFKLIPLGLDLSKFTTNHQPQTTNHFTAGIVGRLTEIKDHAFFLDAIAQWKGDARFLVIGNGHLRESLEARAKELGLTDRVEFLGNRDDPEVFYKQLDLLVLTSKNEGTPLTIIEAMACGIPTLSTAVGGVPDLLGRPIHEEVGVTIRERGVTVPQGDLYAFGRALSLLEDATLREQLGARAREHALAHYSVDRLVRDVRTLYESLLHV